MILTIDTNTTINPTDRAILRALLDDPTPDPTGTPPHQHAPQQRPVESIQDRIRAKLPDTTIHASMKLPVNQQPGVTTTPSTREETSQPE